MNWIRNWPLFLSTIAASVLLSNLPVVLAQTKASQRQVVPETTSSSEVVEQGGGAYYALVIGIANYQHLPKLITPVSDAGEIEKALRLTYGFKTQFLPDATRDQILTALDHDRHTLGENDSLLIYYAGHGFHDKSEDQA